MTERRALRLAGVVEESVVDGPGLRFVVFTQGCPHRCAGCHNPETHDHDGGYWCETDSLLALYDQNPLLSGITFSGGEPFLQAEALCPLAEKVRERGGTVVTYTGYTFENLVEMTAQAGHEATDRLLELTDLLVDGPYQQDRRDLDLSFRGSSNQRLLDREQRCALKRGMAARHSA